MRLFTADAAYHETPFDPPMTGSDAIRRYWPRSSWPRHSVSDSSAALVTV